LLKKGLKHCPTLKTKNIDFENLAIDTDIALDRDTTKKHIAKDIILKNKFTRNGPTDNSTIVSINKKISDNDLLISKADKGNCTVILNKVDYIEKVGNVLNDEKFVEISRDPTNKYNDEVIKLIKDSPSIFSKFDLFRLKQMNPQCPRLYGLPKVHKDSMPCRPVVSFYTAPTYKLAKHANNLFYSMLKFNPPYTVKNSLELIDKIQHTKVNSNNILVSFDVVSLFTSVPVNELKVALNSHIDTLNINPVVKSDLVNLLNLCIDQNYFSFNNKIYTQQDGLSMGSPLSPVLADFFMSYLEAKISMLPLFKKIIFYHRYVDDILCLWSGTERQLSCFLSDLNKINPSIQFTMEVGGKTINFLDLNISILDHSLKFDVFRKPTFSDNIIHASSQHHISHKMSVFHSLIHRLVNIPLSVSNFNKELDIIKLLASNNGYNVKVIDKLLIRKNKQIGSNLLAPGLKSPRENDKWVKLRYIDGVSNKISKVIKKNNLKAAFYNKLNLKSFLVRNKDKRELLDNSGVYLLNCNSCPSVYVGQSGRSVKKRVHEHFLSYKNRDNKSSFGEHLNEHSHNFDPDSGIKLIHKCEKGRRLDRLEALELNRYNVDSSVNILNDQMELNNSPLLKPIV
jgi:hypothetical protein